MKMLHASRKMYDLKRTGKSLQKVINWNLNITYGNLKGLCMDSTAAQ